VCFTSVQARFAMSYAPFGCSRPSLKKENSEPASYRRGWRRFHLRGLPQGEVSAVRKMPHSASQIIDPVEGREILFAISKYAE